MAEHTEAAFGGYLPIIEPIIAQYNIPADFKYLPLIESGAQNYTVSSRGAAGFWQLMPGTARLLGLRVDRRQDERLNLRKATNAACRYLRELYEQLGSWMLVAAAYNAGPNHVQAIRRQFPEQHALTLPYHAAATKSYVFHAVALKELFTKPQAYRAYLSERAVTQLSIGNPNVTEAERLAILDTFDPSPSGTDDVAADSVLASDTTDRTGIADAPALPEKADEPTAPPAQAKPAQVAVPQLETRSLTVGLLTEGQLCLFEAAQSTVINGIAVAVGDLIYAHIDAIDPTSGRVFLRTEKVVSTQTQNTVKLRLTAVDTIRQPGIVLPNGQALTEGSKLVWEAL